MTLNEWTEQWLETYVKPVAKPSGYEHYCDNMYKHILPKLGNLPMNELTTAVVQQFLNGEALHGNLRTGGPLSAKSVKNMRVVLDVCCKRAVADGIMPVNPVPATVYTHCRLKKLTVLSDDAQATLEKWLFSDLSLNNAGIILALYTGMRLGEVCAVRWKDYDAASGTLHITQTVRRVTIDPSAEYGENRGFGTFSLPAGSAARPADCAVGAVSLAVWQGAEWRGFHHLQRSGRRARPGPSERLLERCAGRPAPAARSVSRHSPYVCDARHRARRGRCDGRRSARARRCDDYYALLRSSARSVHAPRHGGNRAGRENRSRMAEHALVCAGSRRGENPESGTENTSAAQTYRGMCLKYTKGKSFFMNNDRRLCKVCGENRTSSPDGLCWKCWEKENEGKQRDPEALQKAIERTQLTLTILKYRAEGISYQNIARIVELPVQTCYAMVERAIGEGKK